ncbi:hypothetical protein EDB89DRAFT_1903565 [Lactarius sanguifluus]|nr:hypothetical protein EDB89DRAFT_1903565 [Lactarius sanguifluus]
MARGQGHGRGLRAWQRTGVGTVVPSLLGLLFCSDLVEEAPLSIPKRAHISPPPLRAHAQHVWRGAVREIHRRCTVTTFVLTVSSCREAGLEALRPWLALADLTLFVGRRRQKIRNARMQTAREYHAQLAWHRRGSSNGQIDGRVIAFAKLGNNGRKESVCISNIRFRVVGSNGTGARARIFDRASGGEWNPAMHHDSGTATQPRPAHIYVPQASH